MPPLATKLSSVTGSGGSWGREARRASPGQYFDHGPAECRQVFRFARGHQVAVDHDFRVFPAGAGVHDIVLDGEEAGSPADFEDASRTQDPGGMADGGDELVLGVELPDKVKSPGVAANVVGCVPARDNDAIEVAGRRLV